ncbi:MAG: CDP-diacylglycerol--glycerol-3-phosphate 3-phosphatidyltransferase [Oscillospiraceae bacterium]|nr:CDP-diacylglycerol--glycerol-3-phosphate 3-phosphatidyltransferase [Oscillospiraceae bacterium]
MNLPNKLTLLRIVLVPVFLACMYVQFPFHFTAALVVFALASITDALDGHIARSRNLITTFGKFADPLADKILVLAAFAAMADISARMMATPGVETSLHVSGIVVTIIAAREFMVSGLRLVTAEKGIVVAAGIWGKLKTAFTMVTQVVILLYLSLREDFVLYPVALYEDIISWILFALVWISVILTVISGAVYLKGYWKYIDMK